MVNVSTHRPRPSPPRASSTAPALTAIVRLPNQPTTSDRSYHAGDGGAPLALALTAISTLSSPGALLRRPRVPISGNWECQVCERSMKAISKDSHLRGKPHAKSQLSWEAERQKEKKKREADEELRRTERVRVAEQTRRNREEKERNELRRNEQIQIQEQERRNREEKARDELRRAEQIEIEEEARKKEEKEREELRMAEQIQIEEEARKSEEKEREMLRKAEQTQIEEETRKNEEKERGDFRRTEQILIQQFRIDEEKRRRVEQLQIAEERKELELVEKEKRDQENATAAGLIDEQLRIKQDNQRKDWMWKQEEAAAAAWRTQELLRSEQENRRKERMRKREEEAAAEWQMEEQIRLREEYRRKEWMRKQEEQASAAWRMEEQLRIEDDNQRKELMGKQEAAVAAAWRLGESLRLEQDNCRKERMREKEEAAAAAAATEYTRIVKLRKQEEEEAWQTQELQRAEEREYVERIAEEARMEAESRREEERNQRQKQADDKLTHEQVELIHNIDLPPVLYRVYDDTSVSKYSWEGFTAAAPRMPQDALSFKHMVHLHGNWSSREWTPFISVTSNPDTAAWHVRTRQASRNQSNIMVALIDTAALLGPCQTSVWKMHDARDHFALQPWRCPRRAYDNEYICALRIPARAIFACCQSEYVKENVLKFLERDRGDTGGERLL